MIITVLSIALFTCIISAAILMYVQISGWGWLIFLSFLLILALGNNINSKDKENNE